MMGLPGVGFIRGTFRNQKKRGAPDHKQKNNIALQMKLLSVDAQQPPAAISIAEPREWCARPRNLPGAGGDKTNPRKPSKKNSADPPKTGQGDADKCGKARRPRRVL